ncbi:MmgE/PrpD family protein [Thalassobaculum sp. OXR-137]|uniref:MmgE/PrpD family protein n=1 Tax=Thalassobaculum sp. OXR-137 TaxID=3100173 RepID=UPI002AC97D7D|nr:MmgE/PrpD family protein [Thalassobaculum sp. OXR-137]WPZ32564.1 MmgE/PrpD family protein [Thalassobaculum sp. OXR-137]
MASTHAADTDPVATAPTRALADWIAATPGSAVDARALRWARHCLMDWIGVTVAGAGDPLVAILLDEALADGGEGDIPLVGLSQSLRPSDAILINGAAGHALDFDDVNRTMHGHPTVAVMPAVLTAAIVEGRSLEQALRSFVIGYEIACRIGEMTGDGHYDTGWHATATMGTFGAAAGVCHLLGLDAERTAHALGLATTLASGLKSQFGTMGKPLHAGRAAQNGTKAARWAARGFTSRPDGLECVQGFWETQGPDAAPYDIDWTPGTPFLIERNLFKFHAACYMTHSAIEANRTLRTRHGIDPVQVKKVTLKVSEGSLRMCNIPEPETGLQVKFSLRHTAALALAGRNTGAVDTFSDAVANEPDLIELRRRVEVQPVKIDRSEASKAEVVVELTDGRVLHEIHDVGVPATDLDDQEAKLSDKFATLIAPLLGTARAQELRQTALTGTGTAPRDLLLATRAD